MRKYSRLLLLACFMLLVSDDAGIAADPPFDVRDVKAVSFWMGVSPQGEWGKEYQYLLRMGDKVFPAYKAILNHPETKDPGGVFYTLRQVEADRRCFIKYVRTGLTHTNYTTRHTSIALLAEIGSCADGAPLVALLSDEKPNVVYAAARALAAIGGSNDLLAMGIWLRGVTHSNDPDTRQRIQECRDELKKRLDEEKDPKMRAKRIQYCADDLRITSFRSVFIVQLTVRRLTDFENETVDFFKKHLHPVPAAAQKELDQLLSDLDSDSLKRREAAKRELSCGIVADSVLEKALANRPSLEMRRRLEAILEELPKWRTKNSDLLGQVRAVWVLQQIGTPEAKALLEKIAAGAPFARLTQKAKDVLASLKKQQEARKK